MSHKRAVVESAPGVQLSLIITPMLDMSFQILAFFIMTYHPAALEGHIPGSMTPPENPAVKGKNAAAPALSIPEDKLMAELDNVVTVQIKAVLPDQEAETGRKAGTPAQLFLRGTIDTAPEMLAGSDRKEFDESLKDLEKTLKQMAGKGGKSDLKIAGDANLKITYLLQVYDAAKRAGYDKIHFVPPQIKTKIKQ
jgi:biopolymer transport protein ExbD